MFITTTPLALSEAPSRRPGHRLVDALTSATRTAQLTTSRWLTRPKSGDAPTQTPSEMALRSAHEPISWYR